MPATNEELMDAVIRVERQIANLLVRIEVNNESRFEAMNIQLTWYQTILFKFVVPILVGLLLLLTVKESNAGMVVAKFVSPG